MLHLALVLSLVLGGPRDFDFETGTWNIHVARLLHPLSNSHEWAHPRGYVHMVRPVLGGKASLAQLVLDDPQPAYVGLMLRMYDPAAHEWRVYWGSADDGQLSAPLLGGFSGGRGVFTGSDTFNGKPIVVRVIYSAITPTSFHTEQAFSADRGKTWEVNLIQDFVRTSAGSQ